ncbi:MAG: serine/threonine protein kinase [Myxococcales bacterium]|nr:serine/threonine protein kinase [Myxococcales bacterium]
MIWKRFRRRREAAAPPSPPAPAEEPKKPPPPRRRTPEERLATLAEGTEVPDASQAVALFEQLLGEGRAARALDLARRLLDRFEGPATVPLALRVAETLASRGDDEGAAALLAPLVASTGAPLPALVLSAEIAERASRDEEARILYERVLAHDLDFPRARERAQRLRERAAGRPEALAGATLATEGAMARGRYRVESELGRGGAGTVFAAFDIRLRRRVALKVYHGRGRVERERLLIEARTPARLEHPGVVRVFDLDPPLGAIAMELVGGGAIRRELGRGPIPVARAQRWLSTFVDALGFVHAAGFVHQDIKPSNLLLRDCDRVVLTDFGLALRIGEGRPGALGEGTLQYMSPEQRANAPAAPSMDVFALGVTLREISEATLDAPELWSELAAACTRRDASARPSLAELAAALAVA